MAASPQISCTYRSAFPRPLPKLPPMQAVVPAVVSLGTVLARLCAHASSSGESSSFSSSSVQLEMNSAVFGAVG